MAKTTKARTTSPALTRTRTELEKKDKSLKSARAKLKEESGTPGAIRAAVAAAAGGIACGATAEMFGDEIMGAPSDVVVGVALVSAGLALGQPRIVEAAGGAFACYSKDASRSMFSGVFSRKSEE